MEHNIPAEIIDHLSDAREIEDLRLQVQQLRAQNGFLSQQMRTLRVRAVRYENILGIEDQEAA
jgi:hypothetical protein